MTTATNTWAGYTTNLINLKLTTTSHCDIPSPKTTQSLKIGSHNVSRMTRVSEELWSWLAKWN